MMPYTICSLVQVHNYIAWIMKRIGSLDIKTKQTVTVAWETQNIFTRALGMGWAEGELQEPL